MTSYSIHSLDDEGRVALSRNIRCRDDLDALSEGVRRSSRNAIEIFDGPRLVARVKLDNAPLDTQDSHSL